MPTAVVTGATAGIGRGFADALAAKGWDLVLVAREEHRLATVAGEIGSRHGVSAETVSADLATRDGVAAVAARLTDPRRPVGALVNAAGFGLSAKFLDNDADDEERLIDVHIVAVMRLCHAVLPGMIDRGFGVVINVSSVAGFVVGGTYSAAKSWVTVFTESLAARLADSGVHFVACCPGYTHTEFHGRADLDMTPLYPWLWLDVPAVVDEALRDASRGRVVSIAGPQYKVLTGVMRHAPRAVIRRTSVRNPRFGRP
jgi:short-subunit dehydrogenase